MEKRQAHGEIPKFVGEILVCEDSEINQYFIKSHLTRLGLDVVIASNGREGADIIASRVKSGAKLFDLIFMDIQMPVMGGLEASDIISKLEIKTPVVALTSNVTQYDKDIYALHGMPKSLCKPFTEAELWECLYEYFTPVGHETVCADERAAEERQQQRKLYSSFVRRNQKTYENICGALEAGDVKLAHRLAHTLRGLAGLMGKTGLMEASRAVETALSGGDAGALEGEALKTMGDELKAVLSELAPFMDNPESAALAESFDKKEAKGLLDKLEPLLRGDNAESQKFADKLRAIPGAGELVAFIEDYEFEEALDALIGLRKILDT